MSPDYWPELSSNVPESKPSRPSSGPNVRSPTLRQTEEFQHNGLAPRPIDDGSEPNNL